MPNTEVRFAVNSEVGHYLQGSSSLRMAPRAWRHERMDGARIQQRLRSEMVARVESSNSARSDFATTVILWP